MLEIVQVEAPESTSEIWKSRHKTITVFVRLKKRIRTCKYVCYFSDKEERNNTSSLTDKDINRMAQNIGREYESLAIELGLSQAELDHINIDSRTTVDRIRRVLVRWRDKMRDEADLDALTEAMKAVGIDYSSVLESETTPLKI